MKTHPCKTLPSLSAQPLTLLLPLSSYPDPNPQHLALRMPLPSYPDPNPQPLALLLPLPSYPDPNRGRPQIQEEWEQYGDLVRQDFVDSYQVLRSMKTHVVDHFSCTEPDPENHRWNEMGGDLLSTGTVGKYLPGLFGLKCNLLPR